jgi:hypothetical protein
MLDEYVADMSKIPTITIFISFIPTNPLDI